MKFSLVIVVLFFASFSSKAQLAIGGGLAYGTDIESLGITIKGNYSFAEEWDGSGSFTYFFPKDESDFLDINLWEFNAGAHYIASSNEKFTFSGNFFDILDLTQASDISVTNGSFEVSF